MIIEYYIKHKGLILKQFELSKAKDNIEAIHNLRLSLKRIKVVNYLMEELTGGLIKAYYEFSNFKSIFKIAGRLRDVQVQVGLQNEYDVIIGKEYSGYKKHLLSLEKDLQKKYTTTLENSNLNFLDVLEIKIKRIQKDFEENEILTKARIISENKFSVIHSLYVAKKSKKNFHKIRTELKDINYLNNITQGRLGIHKILNIDEVRLSELGNLFGSWHDKVNASQFFKKYLAAHNDNGSGNFQTDLLKTQIKKDRTSEFEGIRCDFAK